MCKSEVTEKVQSVFTISMNVNNVKIIDQLTKCETITLKTEWGTLIKFQIDNGEAVNIIPISIYETASKDYKYKEIKTSTTKYIISFRGTNWNVRGERIIEVQRRNKKCLIRLLIVEGNQFHSIIGRAASVELGCIKILDNDERYKQVNQIKEKNLIIEDIINEYEDIFNGTVGKLEGNITIQIKEGAQPIKHAQRTVSVPLRERKSK